MVKSMYYVVYQYVQFTLPWRFFILAAVMNRLTSDFITLPWRFFTLAAVMNRLTSDFKTEKLLFYQ